MALPLIVTSAAKFAGSAAASAGKTAATQAITSKVQDFINKAFGVGGDNAAKKEANRKRDIPVNLGHASNFFNSIRRNESSVYSGWRNALTDEELDDLEQQANQRVAANPYYGGLGASYASKYSSWSGNTVPAVGIAQDIDNYIASRGQTSQSIPNIGTKYFVYKNGEVQEVNWPSKQTQPEGMPIIIDTAAQEKSSFLENFLTLLPFWNTAREETPQIVAVPVDSGASLQSAARATTATEISPRILLFGVLIVVGIFIFKKK